LKFNKVIGKDMVLIAACLGLSQVEIERLRMENPTSMNTVMHNVLLAWKNKLGHAATLGKLEDEIGKAEIDTGACIDWWEFHQAKDAILKKREEDQTNSDRRGSRMAKCCII
jgi:hypothetical protein